MRKFILVIFIILFIPVLLMPQDITKFKLKDTGGKKFIIKNHLDNDATIILFWATWCLPCKKEFPAIQNLLKKYPDKNIKVITVSQDSPRSLAKVKSYVKTHHYDFIYLLDPNKDMSNKLLINSVPYSLLVDSEGKVIYSHRGYQKGDELELEKEMIKYWNKRDEQNKKGNIE